MKDGQSLICKVHGPEALLIEECAPDFIHRFVIKCKKCRKPYKNWARAEQIEQLLRAYPNCDARSFVEPH